MCGIAGIFGSRDSAGFIQPMTDVLAHRGPDAGNFFVDDEQAVYLGHRRLSIIDLSEAANQPLYSQSGNSVIVFNGEIYNFQSLKAKYNLHTRTSGDTEVIIELYEKIGADIVRELNGIFAFAIWDKQKQRLFVARDHMGVKPLYYFFDGKEFVFASELKSFQQHQKIGAQLTISKAAVNQFLYLGYIPAPHSIFSEIKKFPQGHYGFVSNASLEIKKYWSPADCIHEKFYGYDVAKKKLHGLLLQSVERQMISDVPIGTFLSGGIDSSMVTALAQKISAKPVKTFSIGFKEAKFNESKYARAVSDHLKTEHFEFVVSEKDALYLFEDIISTYDEPFADSSSVPTMLVSKLARQHVTVTLSGDGGDEQFMGYGMYNWAGRLQQPWIRANQKWLTRVLQMGNNRMQRAAKVLDLTSKAHIKSHIFSQEQYCFSESELPLFLKKDWHCGLQLNEGSIHGLLPEEEQALFDMRYYLPDNLLVKVDRASMKYSLEARVPLLDFEIIEFSLNLPLDYKLQNGISKYILKDILYDYLPRKIFERPKWGFGMPIENWLRTDLKHWLDEYVNPVVTEKCGMFNTERVMQLRLAFEHGKDYLYKRLWQIILLHKWYLNFTK